MEYAAKHRPHQYQPRADYEDGTRQAFHHSRTSLGATHHPQRSLGAAGHWIHLLSVAAPLVIGEVVKDADTRWRALRGVSVGAALLSEAVWTYRISQDKKKDKESRAALKACEERSI
jgi:hypothetical protein